MKKIIALLPIFCLTLAFSQNSKNTIDSLYRALKQTQKPSEQVSTLSNIAENYGYAGQQDSNRIICQQMLKIATDSHVDSLLALAYLEIGSCFGLTSDFKEALEFGFKSLDLAEKSKNNRVFWLANKQTGVYFKQLKNYPEALKYLVKSTAFISQAAKEGGNDAYNRTYTHVAEVYLGLGQIDSALRYIQLTNELTPKEDGYGYARMLYIFAKVYQAKGDADLAENYYKKCIAFSASENIATPYINATTEYGQYLLNTGQNDLSKQYALAGFNRAIQSKNKLGVIDAAALLRKAYYAVGQKDSSYYFADMKDAYRDSVFNEQQVNQIQNISFAQQIKEKEDEARLAEEADQRKQNIQFILIAFGIITFVMLFLLLSRRHITNTKVIQFLGVVALLVVFEFLNLLLHPFLERITHHSPVLMLLALVCIAALLVPLHHKLEKWATHKLVEKNKAVRLAVAKKTIEQLEK